MLHSATRRSLLLTACLVFWVAKTPTADAQIVINSMHGVPLDGIGGTAPMLSPVFSTVGMGGSNRLPNDTIQLLRMPQIINEIGLDEDQIATIGQLSQEMQKQIQNVFRSADFSSSDIQKIMREAQRTIREKTEEKLEEVLLPNQLRRFKQIKVQISLKNQGARSLLAGELAETIKLSDKQRTELMQVHAKKQAELQIEIELLREKYRKETLQSVLSKTQLRDLEQLAGDDYEVKKPDYQSIYPRISPPAKPTREPATKE